MSGKESIFERSAGAKREERGGEEVAKTARGSVHGRPMTTIESAKKELHYKSDRVDPIQHIEEAIKRRCMYFGQVHNGEKKGEPFFIPNDEKTHTILVGSTGTGKGVLIGNFALEAIKMGIGLIVIDPKQDVFLPQILLEELTRQGRPKDLQVCSWPFNFGYNGINEWDSPIDIANKLTDALSLEEVQGNEGANYYRRNGRVLLLKVLKIFFSGDLGVIVKKDLQDILDHIRYLKEDLEKASLLQKLLEKNNYNADLARKYQQRYYDKDKLEAIYWDETTLETIDSLSKAISELSEVATITSEFDLRGALYEGKVLYVKVDMLDAASLKMVKVLIADAIQQARRRKANVRIIDDEISFTANSTLSGALATVRSMGLEFVLALQDLSQMRTGVREAIMSNCNVKIFYKISDDLTIKYVQTLGGKEVVSTLTVSAGNESIKTAQEDALNMTRIRALPRAGVGIVIAEYCNAPVIVQTNYIATSKEFDWDRYNRPPEKRGHFEDVCAFKRDRVNYELKVKEVKALIEGSELFGISFESTKIAGGEEL